MARERSTNPLLVIALLGLVGGGGYNYQRNYRAEAVVPRPYASYSEQDLTTLLEAYRGEAEALESRYQGSRQALAREARAGMLDENVRAFEEAQRRGARARTLGAELSMQEAAAREIAAELERREDEQEALQVHLRRLLTL